VKRYYFFSFRFVLQTLIISNYCMTMNKLEKIVKLIFLVLILGRVELVKLQKKKIELVKPENVKLSETLTTSNIHKVHLILADSDFEPNFRSKM
jgi:hypothetical protein